MMATQENVRINFVTSYDGKGLNNAKQQLNGFEALANKAAKTFAGLFAAQKVLAFGKATVQAFTQDQAAAASLSKTLTNLGLGFQSTGVEDFIQKLEKTTGVLDDQLRPAFATLARATGSVGKSQELLNLALDISAGTGKDLASVSTALSKGYLGQTTALGRLGAGLSKADLSSKNFKTIQDKLQMLFSGQAATAADTYAGKINRLKVGFDNMKESIGQGLINAFTRIAGPDGSITQATDQMAKFGTTIGDAITGLGVLIGKLNSPVKETGLAGYIQGFTKTTGIGSLNPADFPAIKILAKIGKDSQKTVTKTLDQQLDSLYAQIQAEKKRQIIVKANADAVAKADAAAKKAKTDQLALEKASAALKLASKVTTMDQIQLYAAIAQAQGQDLDRLRLQQALLDGNAAAATTLAAKVLASNGLVMDMQGNIKVDPFASWVTSMDAFGKAAVSALNSLKQIQTQAMLLIPGNTPGSLNSNDLASMGYNTSTNPSGYIAGSPVPSNLTNPDLYYSRAQQEIKVTVDPAAMAYGITLATQNQSSNGTSVATSRNNPTYLNPSSGL